jgi:hypothetical protein
MRTTALAAVIAILVPLSSSCPGQTVRQLTYPPSFQYVEKARLHDAMWGLADRVRALDEALHDEQPQARHDHTAAILDEMKDLAGHISAPGQDTNHPMLTQHLGQFQLDVALARAAIDREPADYAPAGRITGACLYCHTGTGGGPLLPAH